MSNGPQSLIGRRSFLKTAGGLPASMLLAPGLVRADEHSSRLRKKVNFLVLLADDQCYRTIHALNNREVQTPAFDRLAARGTAFTHCFHQGSWTGAICVASRAMLHTGRFLWNCGGTNCGYFPLLGETLQMAGYDTYIAGKWHNGDETALRSFQHGQAVGPGFFASTPEDGIAYDRPRPGNPWTPWDPKYRGHWTPYDLWDIEYPTHDASWIYRNGPAPPQASKRYERSQHSCELYADTVIALLKQAAATRERPFFLYLGWNAPHDPRQAPKEVVGLYSASRVELPPNYLPQHPFDQGDFRVRDEKLAPFPRTPDDVRVHRSEYYALLTFMDRQLGRILDALEGNGQADSTCIIVTSDHGLAVGEHGLMGKQNLYDCSVRVPFIVAGPGIPAGRTVEALVYQHSLFPTLCDLAGVPIPATVQFPSLAPLLRGKRGQSYESVYCAYRGYQRMVRTAHHKLILYPEAKEIQLFDLETDPWETTNVAGQARSAAIAAKLFLQLEQWRSTVNDTLSLDPAAFGIRTS